jgi:hypothetical protein
MSTASPSTPELVLSVHGTFAARQEDRGINWWQVGSPVYEHLRQRIPRNATLPEPNQVFHWSGENSERARIKAAADLLAKLKQMEADGRGYHLVGHSHGGSVIWHALRMATLGRTKLNNLRSWTTVGTPFLRHKMHSTWRVTNIIRICLGLVLLKPACVTAVRFFDLLFRPDRSVWWGNGNNIPEKLSFYETPVLRLMELLRVPMERTASGIRVGSFDASGQHSPLLFLTDSPLGWLMMGLALLVIYFYLNLTIFFLRPVIESWQLMAEARLEREAREAYSSRWLGLWSPDDEAINGLRATLSLSLSFVSRMAPKDRVLFSDYATVTLQPYYWVLTPVFNSLLRPFLDNMVRSIVVKSAQGNNRPGTEVVEIGPAPWADEDAPHPTSLPEWLNQRLVNQANESAREIVPKLRSILAAPSFVSGLEAWGKDSIGREMIHTSYFDHEEVLDLIAMHVAGSCAIEQWPEQGLTDKRIELAHWLAEAKSRVGSQWFASSLTVTSTVSKTQSPVPFLVKPRRRANSEQAA